VTAKDSTSITERPGGSRKRAGVCLHCTSLPGQFGIGEIGDEAFAFVDSLASMGIGVWQILPLGPTGYGDSPYQPLSSFAGNELLIDVATIIRAGLLTSTEADSLLDLPARTVDYGELIPRKTALLQRAAGRFHVQADAEVKSAFDDYLEENDRRWLHDYALFRILKSRHEGRPWTEWAAAFVHRDAAQMSKLERDAAAEIETIKILQFLFYRQWQRLRAHAADKDVLLMGDTPIYVSLDSADVWANRDIVCVDEDGKPSRIAGVPPDYFSKYGQLWGNPVYDWDYHEKTGFRWWIDRLRAALDQADIVRIDHFRGLDSYWSVAAAAPDARDGEWVTAPGHALLGAVQKALGSLPIVAEDLGHITAEVDALREHFGIPGMKVLQFEIARDDFDLSDIDPGSVCYTGTHDNDTTIGWFRGSPDDMRSKSEVRKTQKNVLDLTGGTARTVHIDLIRLAFQTEAWLAIAPLQDYLGLGSEARLNVPGTADANWRWRFTREELTPSLVDSIAGMVAETGRSAAN
jgi:4-alpha-glucanotransferase